jgi:hypothetical protein
MQETRKFVLGVARDTGPENASFTDISSPNRSLSIWCLDFNQCRNLSFDNSEVAAQVIKHCVGAYDNDPYIRRPHQTELWEVFASSYLKIADQIDQETTDPAKNEKPDKATMTEDAKQGGRQQQPDEGVTEHKQQAEPKPQSSDENNPTSTPHSPVKPTNVESARSILSGIVEAQQEQVKARERKEAAAAVDDSRSSEPSQP